MVVILIIISLINTPKKVVIIKKYQVNDYLRVELTKYGFVQIFIGEKRYIGKVKLLRSDQIKEFAHIDEATEKLVHYRGRGYEKYKEEQEISKSGKCCSRSNITTLLGKSLRCLNCRKTFLMISPEEEFWGHCSSLKAWAEHEYNTDLLDSRLAFPLLKELIQAGDNVAKKVLKREIIRKIKLGYDYTIKALDLNGCFRCLSKEELAEAFNSPSFKKALPELYNTYDFLRLALLNSFDLDDNFSREEYYGYITGPNEAKVMLELESLYGEKCSYSFSELRRNNNNLMCTTRDKRITLLFCKIMDSQFPLPILRLEYLKMLIISGTLDELPEDISLLKNLKTLDMKDSLIKIIPDTITTLPKLEVLIFQADDLCYVNDKLFDLNRFNEKSKTKKLSNQVLILFNVGKREFTLDQRSIIQKFIKDTYTEIGTNLILFDSSGKSLTHDELFPRIQFYMKIMNKFNDLQADLNIFKGRDVSATLEEIRKIWHTRYPNIRTVHKYIDEYKDRTTNLSDFEKEQMNDLIKNMKHEFYKSR
ncbi:MAG: hypothetical protein ACFFAS_18920 [Promethearchaeota archaeon]